MSDDGIKLTDDEREQLSWWHKASPPGLLVVVESIIAARVQAAVAAYMDLTDKLAESDAAARAELAAANARIAELEEKLDRLSTEIMDENAAKWGDQPLTDDEKALLLRFNALSVVLDKSEATNAALSARLEQVRALADTWEREAQHWTDHAEAMAGDKRAKSYALASKYRDQADRLRAALGEDA